MQAIDLHALLGTLVASVQQLSERNAELSQQIAQQKRAKGGCQEQYGDVWQDAVTSWPEASVYWSGKSDEKVGAETKHDR